MTVSEEYDVITTRDDLKEVVEHFSGVDALTFDVDGALVALDENGTKTGRFVRDLSDSLADPSITV